MVVAQQLLKGAWSGLRTRRVRAALISSAVPTLVSLALGQIDSSPRTSRRDFLRWTVAGASTFFLAEAAAGFVAFFWPNKIGEVRFEDHRPGGECPESRRGPDRRSRRQVLADQQRGGRAGPLLEMCPPRLYGAVEPDREAVPLPLPRLDLRQASGSGSPVRPRARSISWRSRSTPVLSLSIPARSRSAAATARIRRSSSHKEARGTSGLGRIHGAVVFREGTGLWIRSGGK